LRDLVVERRRILQRMRLPLHATKSPRLGAARDRDQSGPADVTKGRIRNVHTEQ
jgi:hypothetical protein